MLVFAWDNKSWVRNVAEVMVAVQWLFSSEEAINLFLRNYGCCVSGSDGSLYTNLLSAIFKTRILMVTPATTRMLIRKYLFLIISVLVSLVSCSDERYHDSWMWLIVHFTSNFSCGTRIYDSEFAIGGQDATHGPWTVSLGELYWINLPDSVKIMSYYYYT